MFANAAPKRTYHAIIPRCMRKGFEVCTVTEEKKCIDEGIWSRIPSPVGAHILEVAMKHDSEEVQPFRCGFYIVHVDVANINGNEFLRSCLECAEVGWKHGTD